MSVSREEKTLEAKDKLDDSYVCQSTLIGLPFQLTQASKELFERGREGQGYAVICWKGLDENNQPVIYVDLVPAFNKDDGRERTDKNGTPFEFYSYSDEPLGSNTGVIHDQAKKYLLERSAKAGNNIPPREQFTTDVKPEDILGGGIFKGHKPHLLDQIRGKSAKMNGSINYDEEFLWCNFYISAVNEKVTDWEKSYSLRQPYGSYKYFLERAIPNQMFMKLSETLLANLPCDKTTKKEVFRPPDMPTQEQIWWHQNKKNPQIKNEKLMNTVYVAAGMTAVTAVTSGGLIVRSEHIYEPDAVLRNAIKLIKENGGGLRSLR